MYARVTMGQGDPTTLTEGLARYQQDILPGIRQAKGCQGVWILGDRATGKTLAISLWDSEADLQANESMYQDALRRLAATATGTAPTSQRETYEVLLQA